MSKMEFNGIELELDLMDVDNMKKYEDELDRISSNIKERNQYEGKKASEKMQIQCNYIKIFFDNLFGPGTSEKIFKGKNNLLEHMEAFGLASKLGEQTKDEAGAIISKYSPERVYNREQRRARNKFKNKKSNNSAYKYQ